MSVRSGAPWTIYRCARCGWTRSGHGGRCRNAFSDACQDLDSRSMLEPVEVVPVDCEWAEMVEYHMEGRRRLVEALVDVTRHLIQAQELADDVIRGAVRAVERESGPSEE